ncbi:MAG: proline--tRNA ligase, partial [Gaiellales bacterium]
VPARIDEVLREIQLGLLADARSFRDGHTRRITERDEMIEFLSGAQGFAVTAWCGSADCEAKIKTETSATIRCLTLEPEDPGADCPVCGQRGTELATWGQAY